MTFESLIKMLDVLDHDGEILVMEDLAEVLSDYDDENMREVCKISKYSEISDCKKYITESMYHLYIYEEYKPYYELEELK